MDYTDKFKKAFQLVVMRLEGGKTITYPNFDGHTTKYGIIESTYQQFYKGKSVVDCTEEEAMRLYYEMFWKPCNFERIANISLAIFCFAGAVNMGAKAFIKNCVQYAIGVIADGIIGNQTLNAINNDSKGAYDKIYNATKARYETIAKQSGKSKFLKGWMNRINKIPFKYNE